MMRSIAKRLAAAKQQLEFLGHEAAGYVHGKPWRWGNVWFTDAFAAVASYRLSRAAYLALGPGWPAARIALAPALFFLRPWSGRCEIHYQADIGKGLRIMHPTLGVVVSGMTVAGEKLMLVGGNCIGARRDVAHGDIKLGDNVSLGANACVIGPCEIGDYVKIGAGAIVVKDTPDGAVLLAPLATPRE